METTPRTQSGRNAVSRNSQCYEDIGNKLEVRGTATQVRVIGYGGSPPESRAYFPASFYGRLFFWRR
jgi:hypothetical protein